MYADLLDAFKSLISASIVITILTFLVPGIPYSFANAYEFAAYRMQQYDFHGVQRGSRSASISGEVVVYNGQLGNVARKCVLVRFQDVTAELVRAAANQYAACLLVVLPNRSTMELSRRELRYFVDVEHELLDGESITLPVYAVHESAEVSALLDDAQVQESNGQDGAPSITTVLWNSVVRTSSVASVSAAVPRALFDYAVPVVTAQYRATSGTSRSSLVDDDDSDTRRKAIVIVTHYDAFGLSPALSQGADANGSGLVALLELARLLRPLFERATATDSNSAPNAGRNTFKTGRAGATNRLDRVELVFAAAGGGKLNFYGSKRFVEDELLASKSDASNAAGASAKASRRAGSNVVDLSNLNVQLVLCLDTLAASFAELIAEDSNDETKGKANATVASIFDRLYVHVSKMPKRDSPIYRFVRLLETVACEMRGISHCRAAVNEEATRAKTGPRSSEENEEEFDEQTEKPESDVRSGDQNNFVTPFVRVVHKKINLADDRFSWEHERYALKRVAAVTLSALPNGVESRRFARRGSLFDTANALDTNRLQRNVHIIAETIARFIHNVSVAEDELQSIDLASNKANGENALLIDGSSMKNGYMNALVRQLLTQSRSQQLVASPSAAGASKAGPTVAGASTSVVQAIEHLFVRYANAAVRTVSFAMEKHDPEFVLYDSVAQVRIAVHRAKTTVFDFALLLIVSAYLAGIYMFVARFETVLQIASTSSRVLIGSGSHGVYANGNGKQRTKMH